MFARDASVEPPATRDSRGNRPRACPTPYGRRLRRTAAVLALACWPQTDTDALWNAGQRVEAVDAMAVELASNPKDASLRARYVERALAIHRYQAAVDAMEGDGFERQRGLALYHLARYDEAVEHLVWDDALQVLMLVDAFEALGRLDEADRAVDEAERLLTRAHPKVLAMRGRQAQRAGDHARAVADFRAAIDLDPWEPEALFGLGRSLVRSGERDEGLAILERHRSLAVLLDEVDYAYRGIDIAPNHGPNYAHAGDLERRIGRLDRAEQLYGMALERAVGDELIPIALRATRLLVEDKRDLDAGVALLDDAAKRRPDPRLFVRAGDVLRDAGRPGEALERYERARALRPDDAAILARIAAIEAEAGGG